MRIIITENQLKRLLIKENTDVDSKKQLLVAKNLVEKLENRGFSRTGAIGLVANIAHETGGAFDPSINQVGGPAKGLMQWERPRFTALEEYAKHLGKNWGDLNTQLDFMRFELLDKYQHNGEVLPAFKKSPLNAVVYYKQQDGTYKGIAGYETKKYVNSVKEGDIESTTGNLMKNVFRPKEGNLQMRVANAKSISDFIETGSVKSGGLSADDFTVYPNPAEVSSEVTIKVSKDVLPLDKIELKIYSSSGKYVKSHNWNNVSRGILQFDAPDNSGVYLLKINNDITLKMFVK